MTTSGIIKFRSVFKMYCMYHMARSVKTAKGKNKGKLLESYVPPSHHNTHSRCRKFAEIFGEFFFVPEQEKLAELFGYYCYSNNST